MTDPASAAPAASVTPGMWLTIRSGEDRGKTVHVETADFVIGREEGCDLVLADAKVSRRHAAIGVREGGLVELRDLGSGNGTWVNGSRVQSHTLRGSEQVQVGGTVLVTSLKEPNDTGDGTIIESESKLRSHSAIQRLVLQRSVRRATLLSGAAVAMAIVAGGLFVTGVIGGGGNRDDRVAEVVKSAAAFTVAIEGRSGDRRVGGGTGWVLDAKEGLVVTNAHVVNDGRSFRVAVGGEFRDSRVVGLAPCEDLAVLKLANTAGLTTLPLGDQSSLELGETVVAVGYPRNASLEASLTSTTGVVSVVRAAYREAALDIPRYPNVVQTDAAINPGNSGGPLLDLDGRLVGVNSAGRTLTPDGRILQGQNYAIGVDRVKEIVGKLRQGRSLGWTGASFKYLSPKELDAKGLPSGLLVDQAVDGTSAAKAGLRGGGLIVAANGRPLNNSLASYCDAVAGLESGRKVDLDVLAPGAAAPRTVRVSLE